MFDSTVVDDLCELISNRFDSLAEERGGESRLPMIYVSLVGPSGASQCTTVDPVPRRSAALLDARQWLLAKLVELKDVLMGDAEMVLSPGHDLSLSLLTVPMTVNKDGSVSARPGPLQDLHDARVEAEGRVVWG